MRALVRIFFLFVISVAVPLSSFAAMDAQKKKASTLVEAIFPSVQVDNVFPSDIKGWFVVASGDQLVYVNPEKGLIFQGFLIDANNHVNLTDRVKVKLMSDALARFPLENTIKYVQGNGARRLLAFEDPYCKYCRSFTEEALSLTNSTVYVVLYPVLKEESLRMAKKIWCDPNRAKAWHNWILKGVEPKNDGSCATPFEQNMALGRRYSVTGTPTIFLMTGHRLSGAPSLDEINRALGD